MRTNSDEAGFAFEERSTVLADLARTDTDTARRQRGHREMLNVKPIANLDEVEFTDIEKNGYYTSRRAQFSVGIGARRLGYNLTELPPGSAQCPFHSHRGEEEMFLILEGEGELRFGQERYPIRRYDVIACPTGGAEVAHQIINTGSTTMRYLAVSNVADVEICEYPDSSKIMIGAGPRGGPGLYRIFRSGDGVKYYDGESTERPASA